MFYITKGGETRNWFESSNDRVIDASPGMAWAVRKFVKEVVKVCSANGVVVAVGESRESTRMYAISTNKENKHD